MLAQAETITEQDNSEKLQAGAAPVADVGFTMATATDLAEAEIVDQGVSGIAEDDNIQTGCSLVRNY